MATETRTHEPGLNAVESWEPGSPSGTSAIEWLIDNAETYDQLLRAIRTAHRSVWITQLALDVDCVAFADGSDGAESPEQTCGESFTDALLAAAANEGMEIRILLNATLLLDTAKPLRRFLRAAGTNAHRIRVRGTKRFPQLLHAKMVVVDGTEAFLVGSPFVNGYWDDARHRPVDARRPLRELGGRPLHDVSARVTGPVVDDLAATFAAMWSAGKRGPTDRDGSNSAKQSQMPARCASGAVRIVRTVPRGAFPEMPEGTSEILDACLDGIARARSLIYLEQQYLSARPILAALDAALRRTRELEVIIVLNQNPDVTAYRVWQNDRLTRWGLLDDRRVGVFALWSAEALIGQADMLSLNQLFVHSKVMIIDQTWATMGSANLDGVSLHSYGDDFEGRVARRVFRDVRNFDVNAVVDESVEGSSTHAVADLQMRLWSEHLGLAPTELPVRPVGGWLPLWRECAARNVEALNGDRSPSGGLTRMNGFVLPYSQQATPREQLADIGVEADSTKLDVRFDPGWLEVNFSPNWVRNMFL